MKKLNISPIDAIFSNGCYPIEFMLYYHKKIKTGKIRSALKNLSSDFWPMFGEYDNGIIYFEKYMESRCFEEQIVEEEFNSTESPRNLYDNYCRINPTDPQRLFHISILQYQDGTVIIPKLNHLAGDGYSYFYFLSLLAAVCREASIPFKKYFIRSQFKPHHQRNILKEFRFENIGLKPTALYQRYFNRHDTKKNRRKFFHASEQFPAHHSHRCKESGERIRLEIFWKRDYAASDGIPDRRDQKKRDW
jgi:hypothetical protein